MKATLRALQQNYGMMFQSTCCVVFLSIEVAMVADDRGVVSRFFPLDRVLYTIASIALGIGLS